MAFSPGIFLAAHSHTLSFHLSWPTTQAIIALIAGVLVLIRPKNINAILAAYLILIGLLSIVQITF
ncbi:MAG: DUF3096 domain-containing protein [Gluconacetobacter diazotrophicus]|nr:DUF3096 domain-containing protein [Gluconacetobacter diazotrophicus]